MIWQIWTENFQNSVENSQYFDKIGPNKYKPKLWLTYHELQYQPWNISHLDNIWRWGIFYQKFLIFSLSSAAQYSFQRTSVPWWVLPYPFISCPTALSCIGCPTWGGRENHLRYPSGWLLPIINLVRPMELSWGRSLTLHLFFPCVVKCYYEVKNLS